MGLLGRTEPRIWTPPLAELTSATTRGFAFIDWCVEKLGWEPTPWQQWLALHALEVSPADPERYRYRTIVALMGRQ